MKKTILFIGLATLCLNFEAKSQVVTKLFGRVTDSSDNKPVRGATVKIKSTSLSTTTNEDGEFAINTNQIKGVVAISFVGYKTIELNFNPTIKGPFNISLREGRVLKDVNIVSTGYQDIPKERATGSFAQPIKEMYDDRVSTDALSKLNGITSGLLFNANTSQAQSGLDISIRGRSTIFADDQPLIVVDNFPYSGDINNINPNDVESITILKDAAAASIWGVRAGNGVIVITTKKGKMKQPLKVGFNSNITVFNKPDLNYNPNQLSSSSYIGLEKYLFNQGYDDANLSDTYNLPVISPVVQLLAAQRAGTISTANITTQLNALSNVNINDQLNKYFYQKATNQQYAVNLSGGSDKAIYYFSAGYDEDIASLKANANQRITINTQNTFYPIKKLEITVGLNAVQTNVKIDNTLAQTQPFLFPYSQLADSKGNPLTIPYGYNQSFIQSAPANGFLDWSYSPLQQLGESDNKIQDNDIRFTTGLKYTFIKGLSGEIKYQYENSNVQNRDFEGQNSYSTRNLINEYSIVSNGIVTGYNIPLGGILNFNNSNTISNNVRGQLNYNLSWKDNSITALAGYELSQTTSSSNGSVLYGYDDNNGTFTNVDAADYFSLNPTGNYGTINSGLGVSGTLDRIRSTFANIAYTYKDRYTFSGSARIDGSNYFGVATNQKSLPLWSAGAKWAIDKEDFYDVSWLPVLALRATYGYNGNLDRSVTGVTTLLYLSNAQYTNLPYSLISNVGNPDLQWEKTGIANLGIDFGSENNIVTGSIEYYSKKETDLLGYKAFSENSGITSLEGNYSDMEGHGFDLSVTTRNLNGKLKWVTTILFSHATDKVTNYEASPDQYAETLVSADGNQSSTAPVVGKPVFGLYSYKWGGLDPVNGNPVGFFNGVKSEDYANMVSNTPVNDLVYSGPARPTYFGGLNNRFSYKGFNVSFQINYKLGYYFRRPTINYYNITAQQTSFLSVNRDYNNRWMKPGDEKITNVPSLVYAFDFNRSYFYQYSSINVDNGDNVRLQDLSLSYDFNKSAYKSLPFNNLQLFIYANNIGILWRANHDGLDPDAVPTSQFSNTTMPNPRSISIGFKGTF
ncbi:SusC/RagA family TonB-linked outer membrane protein [Mucilaginibacter sp. L196]|uniref:SusC/RagA family TonB-linked outer membrane protein n=1 Tax=Mucilaginibacter sp. L196 TaxID=1641870 RepID=UPI00131B95FB|nr:SusC/RagA family TonB-linked outer membrane protein [Mucilaginibacter sp. L196]